MLVLVIQSTLVQSLTGTINNNSLNTPIYWNTIAGKPVDSNYSDQRSGGGDSIHVVVVDDNGSVTGIQGNILEKHTFLSKAKDESC